MKRDRGKRSNRWCTAPICVPTLLPNSIEEARPFGFLLLGEHDLKFQPARRDAPCAVIDFNAAIECAIDQSLAFHLDEQGRSLEFHLDIFLGDGGLLREPNLELLA